MAAEDELLTGEPGSSQHRLQNNYEKRTKVSEALFRIRVILVRIRIRIRLLESVPLTNGYGCKSVPKSSLTFRMQKNLFFIFSNVLINDI
jgi:hypothetical protein